MTHRENTGSEIIRVCETRGLHVKKEEEEEERYLSKFRVKKYIQYTSR